MTSRSDGKPPGDGNGGGAAANAMARARLCTPQIRRMLEELSKQETEEGARA